MTIHYNVPGKKRKELAKTIGAWLGVDTRYCGAPTFAYEIDYFTLDKDGNLTYSVSVDDEIIDRLLQYLYDNGFEGDMSEAAPIEVEEVEEDCPPPYSTSEKPSGICVSMPRSTFDDRALANLTVLVASKATLIGKALDSTDIAVEVDDERVSFPWLVGEPTPEEIQAFDIFVCKLCEMAKMQHRITAKEKAAENEKYAFRCFLLRLGFIGDKYKMQRKILLRRLTGNSAFKQK